MGGKSSKVKKILNPVEQNWQTLQNHQGYNLVRNKIDGRQGQQYSYILDNRHSPSGQSLIFNARQKSSQPIIRTFEHQFQAKKSSTYPQNAFRVITQRISHRLSECPQLSFDQALYVLSRALQGYQYLYKKVGAFDINSRMIGFTPQGQTRVWHNQNFGTNYPAHEKKTLQATTPSLTTPQSQASLQQIEIVRNIVNVVEDRCEEGQFPQEFRREIRSFVGFAQARNIVQRELQSGDRVRLDRVDLWRNLVKSKLGAARNHLSGIRTNAEVPNYNAVNSVYQPVNQIGNYSNYQ